MKRTVAKLANRMSELGGWYAASWKQRHME